MRLDGAVACSPARLCGRMQLKCRVAGMKIACLVRDVAKLGCLRLQSPDLGSKQVSDPRKLVDDSDECLGDALDLGDHDG